MRPMDKFNQNQANQPGTAQPRPQLQLKSRLPSVVPDGNDVSMLPILSPRTPMVVESDFHPLHQPAQGSQDIQNAMAALDSYGQQLYMKGELQRDPAYGSGFPQNMLGQSVLSFPSGPSLQQNPFFGQDIDTSQPPPMSGNKYSLREVMDGSSNSRNTHPSVQQMPNSAYPPTNQQGKPNHSAPDMVKENYQYNNSANNSQHHAEKEKFMQRRGTRKHTVSLDPAERESLEKLIDEVLQQGFSEEFIEADSNSSDSEIEETQQDKTPVVSELEDGQGKLKNGREKKSSSKQQSTMKVAAKHMKNIPPRFLRKLQAIQSQTEKPDDNGAVTSPEASSVVPPSLPPQEKKIPKAAVPEGIRKNDLPKQASLVNSGHSEPGTVRAGGKSPSVDYVPSPIMQAPQPLTCEDLERRLLGVPGKPGGNIPQVLGPDNLKENKRTAEELNRLAAEDMKRELEKKPMFSVNAPEFVPKAFRSSLSPAATSPVPAGAPMAASSPASVTPAGKLTSVQTSQPYSLLSGVHTGGGRFSPQPIRLHATSTPERNTPSPGPAFMVPKAPTHTSSPVAAAAGVPVIPGYQQAAYPFNPYLNPYSAMYRPRFIPQPAFQAEQKAQANLVAHYQGAHMFMPHKLATAVGKQAGKDKNWAQMLATGHPAPALTPPGGIRMPSSPQLGARNVMHNQAVKLKQKSDQVNADGKKFMIILRGPPGSGKSTLAREIKLDGPVLSTDDFFMQGGKYEYDFGRLGEAHEWNQRRAKEAVKDGKNMIIDNTNSLTWEMKYYVALAKEHGYEIEIAEPETPWKFRAKDLARRNTHGVSLEVIQRMLDRYDHNVSVDKILKSTDKEREEAIKWQKENLSPKQTQDPEKKEEKKKTRRKRKRRKKKNKDKTGVAQVVAADKVVDSSDNKESSSCESDDEHGGSKVKDQLSDTSSVTGLKNLKSSVGASEESVNSVSDNPVVVTTSQNEGSNRNSVESQQSASSVDTATRTSSERDITGNPVDDVFESTTEEAPVKLTQQVSQSSEDTTYSNEGRTASGTDQISEDLEEYMAPELRAEIESIIKERIMEHILNEEVAQITSVGEGSDVHNDSSALSAKIEEKFDKYVALIDRKTKDVSSSNDGSKKDLKPHASALPDVSTTWDNVVSSAPKDDSSVTMAHTEKPMIPLDPEIEKMYWKEGETVPCDPYKVGNLETGAAHTNDGASNSKPAGWEDWEKPSQPKPDPSNLQPKQQRGKRGQRGRRSSSHGSEESGDAGSNVSPTGGSTTAQSSNASSPCKKVSPDIQTGDNQACSTEWTISRFPTDSVIRQKESVLTQRLQVTDSSSMTDPKDFSVTQKINSGNSGASDEIQGVLNAKPRVISQDKKSDAITVATAEQQSLPVIRAAKLFVDRSCNTDNTPADAGIEFLQNCFPELSVNDLQEVLLQCHGDIQWAVNILLDSGFECSAADASASGPRDAEKEQLIQLPPSPSSPDHPSSSSKQCDGETTAQTASTAQGFTLSNLCLQVLSKKTSELPEEIVEPFSRTSISRLRSIDEFSHRDKSDSSFTSTAGLLSPKSQLEQDSPSLQSAALGSQVTGDRSAETISDRQKEVPALEADDGKLVLTLSPQLAGQLERLFGSPVPDGLNPELVSGEQYLQIELNNNSAKQLHHMWTMDLQKRHSCYHVEQQKQLETERQNQLEAERQQKQLEAERQKQLEDDAALARRLQAEEEYGDLAKYTKPEIKKNGRPRRSPSPQKKPQRVLYNMGVDTGVVPVPSSSRDPPPASLQEIMDEELALQQSRSEYLEKQKKNGNQSAVATMLKQQKLLEMFPGVDSTVLIEIFQDHNYELGPTIQAISGSYGDPTMAKTVMSPEALAEYEAYLIKQATEESLGRQNSVAENEEILENYQCFDDPSYKDFRTESNMHRQLRKECFMKAQDAYRRNMKAVASFYAQQGHIHTNKLKEANNRAAQMILEHRRPQLLEDNTLDLHGLHVEEATSILESVLASRHADQGKGRKRTHLIVVTGRGTHSRGGVAKIRPAVINFLQKHGYRYSEPTEATLRVNLN